LATGRSIPALKSILKCGSIRKVIFTIAAMTYMSHLSNIDKPEEQCGMKAKKLTYILGMIVIILAFI
jgi:hypothetical protein